MCILFWTVDNHPKYRFIFASNRDEFFHRPTARAHFWDPPFQDILAGTDLEIDPADHHSKNGTWLGITRSGRFAALTNFREQNFKGSLSRGLLVRDFLSTDQPVHEAMETIERHGQDYGGFNLVSFDFSQPSVEMAYVTNRKNQPLLDLKPKEIYGLSNSILTEPWTKVNQGREAFATIIQQDSGKDPSALIEALFGLLSTTEPMSNLDDIDQIFKDLQLRIHIPRFDWPKHAGLKHPTYGTRTSNVVLIDHDNHVTFVERLWHPDKSNTDNNTKSLDDLLYSFELKL